MQFKRFICFIFIISAGICLVKEITLNETKSIQLQVDHIYQQKIPQFFDLYQSVQIVNFTCANSEELMPQQQICHVIEEEGSSYFMVSMLYHYKLGDPERFYLGHKKLFRFEDLQKVMGVIDVALFDGQAVVLFQNSFYAFYSINTTTGFLNLERIKRLHDVSSNIEQKNFGTHPYLRVINYGDLMQSQQNKKFLVFFGQDQVYLMDNKKKVFEDISGYNPIGYEYEKSIIDGNKIYAACSQQGVHIYEIDFVNKSIALVQKFKPYYNQKESKVFLSVSDLALDKINNKLMVIDQSEGIYWVTIPEVDAETVQCEDYFVLVELCQNLNVIVDQIIAVVTCPFLLIIDLRNMTHRFVDNIDFYPQNLIVNQSRLVLFGQYRYAIYDIETEYVEKGQSQRQAQFILIKDQWMILINPWSISAGHIIAEQENFACAIKQQRSETMLGEHSAKLTIQGICSELFPYPLQTLKGNIFTPSVQDIAKLTFYNSQTSNCKLIYDLKINITNTRVINYIIEFIVGAFIMWLLSVGLIYYCVKDIKVRKQYQSLTTSISTLPEVSQNQMNQQPHAELVEENSFDIEEIHVDQKQQ